MAYARIYPEYDFVFVGDAGEGDVFGGLEMLDGKDGLGRRVRAVLIKRVRRADGTPQPRAIDETQLGASAADKRALGFFDTYAHALDERALGFFD